MQEFLTVSSTIGSGQEAHTTTSPFLTSCSFKNNSLGSKGVVVFLFVHGEVLSEIVSKYFKEVRMSL